MTKTVNISKIETHKQGLSDKAPFAYSSKEERNRKNTPPERGRHIPRHIGIIPDGNRRWAIKNGMAKAHGYQYGVEPGVALFDLCAELGVEELTWYGFTKDNTKRSADQTSAFQTACVDAVRAISSRDTNILVVGDTESRMFPKELLPYAGNCECESTGMRTNMLVNYGWEWDLAFAERQSETKKPISQRIGSSQISRIDLIIRWGGRRRLSGFLPVQSVYSDFFVVDEMWPDFKKEHLYAALDWYQHQDPTLGG